MVVSKISLSKKCGLSQLRLDIFIISEDDFELRELTYTSWSLAPLLGILRGFNLNLLLVSSEAKSVLSQDDLLKISYYNLTN